jgi:hypothetical protein
MSDNHNKISSDNRFVRWQAVLREHVTFLNGLLLTITIGIIGFLISLLGKSDFKLIHYQKIFFSIGLIISFFSAIVGITASISRLFDFRATVNKIKNEIGGVKRTELGDLKILMNLFGKTTWTLFYWQIITLLLSVLSLAICFLQIYCKKLF